MTCACALASSCALLPDMDDFTGGLPDAATSDGGVVDVVTDADAPNGDASDAQTKPICTNGRVRGVAAFDATPSGAKATACAVGNALVADDQVTGLDADDYTGAVVLASGVDAYACVGVEFESPTTQVFVRVSAAATACGVTCTTGYCGTGRYAEIFEGPSRGSYAWVKTLNLGASLAEQTVTVSKNTRVVLVCRGASSKDRDHVAVDAVTAACP